MAFQPWLDTWGRPFVGPLLQLCQDGSTSEARGVVGAAAVFRGPGGNVIAASSHFGTFVGGEAGEHIGIHCSVVLADSLTAARPHRVRLNVDSENTLGRYASAARPLSRAFAYLQPLIDLNLRGLRELQRRGHDVVMQHIPRRLNRLADRLCGEMRLDAQNGGAAVPLVHPTTGTVDRELEIAVAESSRLLRYGAPLWWRPTLPALPPVAVIQLVPGPGPHPSRECPQPPGVEVCREVCSTCRVHQCGFRMGHTSYDQAVPHECYECNA